MTGLTTVTILAIVGMVIITVIYLADQRDERNYDDLRKKVDDLTQERDQILKRLSDLERAKNGSFRHAELVDLDNALGSILGIVTRKEDLKEQAQIINLKADALSRQIETAYQILWMLRGRDKNESGGKPPDLSSL